MRYKEGQSRERVELMESLLKWMDGKPTAYTAEMAAIALNKKPDKVRSVLKKMQSEQMVISYPTNQGPRKYELAVDTLGVAAVKRSWRSKTNGQLGIDNDIGRWNR